MRTPLVSVIIPTYNCSTYLASALESVLRQSITDLEVLVIDDGSSDDTEAVIGRYGVPVRYVYQLHSGVAAARNRGIEESRARYVAFLDADDTWLPTKLERQLAALETNSAYRACYSAFRVADRNLSPRYVSRSEPRGSALEDLLLRGNIIATPSTVVCERSLFEGAGGFDRALSQCADWDMWVRLAALTEFIYLDQPLVTYRQHGANMSRNAPLLERDSLLVLEKGFAMPGLQDSIKSKRRAAFARNYMVLAGTYFHARQYADFARCAAKAVAMDCKQLGYLAAFPARLASRMRPKRSTEGI